MRYSKAHVRYWHCMKIYRRMIVVEEEEVQKRAIEKEECKNGGLHRYSKGRSLPDSRSKVKEILSYTILIAETVQPRGRLHDYCMPLLPRESLST